MADIVALAEQLVNLTVKEVNELAQELETKHNIKPAAAAVAVSAGPAAGGEAAPAAVEKTEFDVLLQSAGANKLQVVKEVKNILGLGLKEAKDLVDAAPSTLKQAVNKEEANNIKTVLEGVGAQVEIK